MAARTGRQSRAQRLRRDLLVLIVIYGLGYVLLRGTLGVVALVLIDFVVFGLWVLLLMPTHCDYMTQRGGHCTPGQAQWVRVTRPVEEGRAVRRDRQAKSRHGLPCVVGRWQFAGGMADNERHTCPIAGARIAS